MDRKLDQKQNLPRTYSPVSFKLCIWQNSLKAKADHTIKETIFRVGGDGFSRSFSRAASKIGRLLNKYV